MGGSQENRYSDYHGSARPNERYQQQAPPISSEDRYSQGPPSERYPPSTPEDRYPAARSNEYPQQGGVKREPAAEDFDLKRTRYWGLTKLLPPVEPEWVSAVYRDPSVLVFTFLYKQSKSKNKNKNLPLPLPILPFWDKIDQAGHIQSKKRETQNFRYLRVFCAISYDTPKVFLFLKCLHKCPEVKCEVFQKYFNSSVVLTKFTCKPMM